MLTEFLRDQSQDFSTPVSAHNRALILYDDLALGTQMRHFLIRLGQNLDEEYFSWHCFAPLLDMGPVCNKIRIRIESVNIILVNFSHAKQSLEYVNRLRYIWNSSPYLGNKKLLALYDKSLTAPAWVVAVESACQEFGISFNACSFHEI